MEPLLSPTIQELLCQPWHWDDDSCRILSFNADGSGEIISRGEMNLWIAAFTQWKVLDVIFEDTAAQAAPLPAAEPTFIGKMLGSPPNHTTILKARVEITLSRNRMASLWGHDITRRQINDDLLLDDAFQAKQYTITVRRGQFATQGAIKIPKRPLYALEMVFDKSPFPAKSEWKPEQQAMVESVRQYEMTIFCARELGRSEDFGSCIIM